MRWKGREQTSAKWILAMLLYCYSSEPRCCMIYGAYVLLQQPTVNRKRTRVQIPWRVEASSPLFNLELFPEFFLTVSIIEARYCNTWTLRHGQGHCQGHRHRLLRKYSENLRISTEIVLSLHDHRGRSIDEHR